MFTGLIEETGSVVSLKRKGGNLILQVAAGCSQEISRGDSVALEGVCLTVSGVVRNSLLFDLMPVTIQNTTLKKLKRGDYLNLERAVRADSRLGGHILSGHVDCVGKIIRLVKGRPGIIYTVSYPPEYSPLIVSKGSVAVAGISLTIQAKLTGCFEVSLIPVTLDKTTLKLRKPGDEINLEFRN
ncbi:MAG: riboflavin synthase [Candidatus Wallbacteria bacterium]|nr:riboflavin synthase [Candidatus Wallbacteria bacterium]